MELPNFENARKWWQAFWALRLCQKIIIVLILLLAGGGWAVGWLVTNRMANAENTKLKERLAQLETAGGNQQIPGYAITIERQAALRGRWKGTATPIIHDPRAPTNFPVSYFFDPTSTSVKGSWSFKSWRTGAMIEDDFTGSFYDPFCFRFVYESRDKSAIGYGTGFFRFHEDGKEIHGIVAGYSSHYGIVFATEVELTPEQ